MPRKSDIIRSEMLHDRIRHTHTIEVSWEILRERHGSRLVAAAVRAGTVIDRGGVPVPNGYCVG